MHTLSYTMQFLVNKTADQTEGSILDDTENVQITDYLECCAALFALSTKQINNCNKTNIFNSDYSLQLTSQRSSY